MTNDDGVDSPGLWALAGAAIDAGFDDVVVAAPSWDSSGSSASLTAVQSDDRLLVDKRSVDSLPGVPVYAVEAAPAFIVRASIDGAFGDPPGLVLSGINNGLNVGRSILHSGTVGAALTARTSGRNSMAMSLASGGPPRWETAAFVARHLLPWLFDADESAVLNVNVPNVPVAELRGLQRGRLSTLGVVQTTVTELGGDQVKLTYTQPDAELEPGTDAALLDDGFVSYTPLLAPCEATGFDTSGLPTELPDEPSDDHSP